MSREQMNHTISRVSGTGAYGNTIIPRESFEKEPELTADQVKRVFEEAQRADQQQQVIRARVESAEAWKTEHPEYIDSEPNAALMNHQLRSMFGDIKWSLEHYDEAFQALCASNFLKLDATVLAAKKRAEAKQYAQAERARVAARAFDPNADYNSMSLDEIRQRANDEIRQQMQRRGEEGGW